ncbi:MAG: serine/threonine protein kinase [Verrucomicrobia bacterium]|nr:serine/threonine protein kinase [Verrucomicrobiota bacterium]
METPTTAPLQLKPEQVTTYSLVRCLGEGGMGSVYEAVQHGADGFTKRVAIKLIRSWVAERPEFLQNFVGEAKLVAQLVHTNIVQTYQFGRCNGAPFIAMEFIQGTDLLQLMHVHVANEIRVPGPLAVFIASRICRGLAYAHSKVDDLGRPLGIVHRDISPQNIMISRDGDVKITDFGMAKGLDLMLDGEGEVVMGKLRYMSPEQARGDRTDGRSDLFSVGVVLSEMLIGVNIFAAETSAEVQRRLMDPEIPDFDTLSPEMNPTLRGILRRALAKDPDERYQAASDMLVELERFIYSAGYGPTSETLADYVRDYLDSVTTPPATDANLSG